MNETAFCSGTLKGSRRGVKPRLLRRRCPAKADLLVGTARVPYCAKCSSNFPSDVPREPLPSGDERK